MAARLLLILVCGVLAASAQFSGLATNDDGSVLYFCSDLRLRGMDQYPHAKIFCIRNGTVELFAQRPEIWPDTVGRRTSNHFQLSRPDVSGDGRVVSYLGTFECRGAGSGCLNEMWSPRAVRSTVEKVG
ncbi:MAG: hypothetical protein GY953_45925, partial [bacterium]|nr:hypothetical protein [bacterium]